MVHGVTDNPASAGFIHLRIISLLALARVEPTHHACHLTSLSRSPNNTAPLCLMADGAVSGSPSVAMSGAGMTSKSLGGLIKAEGGVVEFEQPAISNALSGIRIFDAVTVNHLFLDYFDGANLRLLGLLFCKL